MSALGRIDGTVQTPSCASTRLLRAWRTPSGHTIIDGPGGRMRLADVTEARLVDLLRLDRLPEPSALDVLELRLARESDPAQSAALEAAIAAMRAAS